MITQVKEGYKYINISIMVLDDDNKPTNLVEEIYIKIYKVNQDSGELDFVETHNLTVQNNESGFYGKNIDISEYTNGEYIVVYYLKFQEEETKTIETFSINLLENKIDNVNNIVGGVSENVEFIKDVESGRWKIDKNLNQMIFYKSDNTELMRFNLFDVDGNPTISNVAERRRV